MVKNNRTRGCRAPQRPEVPPVFPLLRHTCCPGPGLSGRAANPGGLARAPFTVMAPRPCEMQSGALDVMGRGRHSNSSQKPKALPSFPGLDLGPRRRPRPRPASDARSTPGTG